MQPKMTVMLKLTVLNRTSADALQKYLAVKMIQLVDTFNPLSFGYAEVKTVQTLGWWNVHHVTIEYLDNQTDSSIIKTVLVNQIGSDKVGDVQNSHIKFTDVKESK